VTSAANTPATGAGRSSRDSAIRYSVPPSAANRSGLNAPGPGVTASRSRRSSMNARLAASMYRMVSVVLVAELIIWSRTSAPHRSASPPAAATACRKSSGALVSAQ
jgi:hypothetical protein